MNISPFTKPFQLILFRRIPLFMTFLLAAGYFLFNNYVQAQNSLICPSPADFNLITPCYVNGARTSSPNDDVIVLFNHTTARGTAAVKQVVASYSEVGTVWGLAYNPHTKKLYAAAFLKRHCDLSPDGLGAIYEIDLTTPTTAGAGTPTLWMNLNSTTHLGAGATLFPTETAANRGLGAINLPSRDVWAYTRVGKQGLGDIEITEDGTKMYVMDLTNRQVLEINMATKTVTNRYAVNAPANYTNAADRRPFGIKHHNGELYIGLVSSGETAGLKRDVRANVMKLSGSSFINVYEVDSMAVVDPSDPTANHKVTSYRGNPNFGTGLGWNNYSDNDMAAASPSNNPYAYIQNPVPLVSDIEFDNAGNIVIGIMDWSGHRMGAFNYRPFPTTAAEENGLYNIQSHGDVIRAIKSGSAWVKESGVGDFYNDMKSLPGEPGWQDDTFKGGMIISDCNGTELVVANMQDPYTTNEGGTIWMKTGDGLMQTNNTGSRVTGSPAGLTIADNSRVRIYLSADAQPSTFGKAAGLGDIVATYSVVSCTKPVAKAIPKTQTICAGGTLTAYTTTSGTGVDYKWYGPLADTTGSLGTAISGQTNASYIPIGAALTTVGTKYYAVIVNTAGDATCADTAFVQLIVNAKPNIADGTATICAGESVDLTSKIAGYATLLSPVWTVATAGGTAVTTPTAVRPSATTTYVLVAQNAAGCKDTANVVVTVNAKPNAGVDRSLPCADPVAGTLQTTTNLTGFSPAGGMWTAQAGNPAAATVTNAGLVSGMSVAGTYKFIYTSNTCSDTVAVTVEPCAGCVKPDAGADQNICAPTTTATLTGFTPSGGTWTAQAGNPAAVTVTNAGAVSGMTANGTYKFIYSVTQGGQTCSDTVQIVRNIKPVVGNATICAPATAASVSRTPSGGTWTADAANPAAATITATGAISGLTANGTYKFIYTLNGCSDTATVVRNAKPDAGVDRSLPCADPVAGTLQTTTNLTGFSPAGGTWSAQAGNPAAATVTNAGAVSGMTAAGTYKFIYTLAGCTDTVSVIVEPCAGCVKPDAGADQSICAPTVTAALTDFTPSGGIWVAQAGNPVAVTVTNAGAVSGMTANGTYKFIYSVTQGGQTCSDTVQIVRNAKPTVGDAAICAPATTTSVTLTPAGGAWTADAANPAAATITAAGAVSGLTANGTYKFVYTLNGCSDTATVIRTAKPNAGVDRSLLCADPVAGTLQTTTNLTGFSPAGGTWSAQTGNPAAATVTNAGAVSGMTAAGTYKFIYTLAGCTDTVSVTVEPCAGCIKPDAGADQTLICTDGIAPGTTALAATPTGGTWAAQAGNPATATVTNTGVVTGMTTPGVYKFIYSVTTGGQTCQDTVVVTVPNCNCTPKVPTLINPSLTACIGDTFPTLKATVVGLATVEWFTQATGGTPVFTGLNYKPAGTVPTTGSVFYAQARSTDPACPTAISTSRVMATVNAQNCTVEVDLALKKSINAKIAQLGDLLTYTLKVWNESNTNATGVEVTDSIATTVQFQTGSFTASRGSAAISGNVIKWTIGNIAANWDTVTLTYKVKATQEGVHFNTAEISKTNEKDIDSTPGNGKDGEDDIDSQCFTVPIKLCPGEKVQASVPAYLTNVQWFKNGTATAVASGNTVLLTETGSYRFTATNQTCPIDGCCPVIIEPGTNCCPEDLCVPFTVKKKRK